MLRSYGPGAAPNIRDLVHNPEHVCAESDLATYLNPMDAQYSHFLQDRIYWLLKGVAEYETVFDGNDEILGIDLTWGLYAFVVDYEPDTLGKILAAMHNLIKNNP